VHHDPASTEAHYRYALALWSVDERDEAKVEMQRVLGLDASQGRAHERLAVWEYYAGNVAPGAGAAAGLARTRCGRLASGALTRARVRRSLRFPAEPCGGQSWTPTSRSRV
jgi:hypothetical protein